MRALLQNASGSLICALSTSRTTFQCLLAATKLAKTREIKMTVALTQRTVGDRILNAENVGAVLQWSRRTARRETRRETRRATRRTARRTTRRTTRRRQPKRKQKKYCIAKSSQCRGLGQTDGSPATRGSENPLQDGN